jgi:hypothetical protein
MVKGDDVSQARATKRKEALLNQQPYADGGLETRNFTFEADSARSILLDIARRGSVDLSVVHKQLSEIGMPTKKRASKGFLGGLLSRFF